ncbi:MAG: hypothetical protein ACLVJ6_14925 [Merdibacter sp.]
MTVVTAMDRCSIRFRSRWAYLHVWLYIDKDVDIEKSTAQVEIFDTGVALLRV